MARIVYENVSADAVADSTLQNSEERIYCGHCRGRVYRYLNKNDRCITGLIVTGIGIVGEIGFNVLLLSADTSQVRIGITAPLVILNVTFGGFTLLGAGLSCYEYYLKRKQQHG